ncbi:uncharacterized protein LOC100240848 isoform X3 [Vitis vinifera]|uniref:uncharacterized protein LOC100240848 isoform X3 n=1 Tax=Vitis vinifera TaxID=29760 RepID=UPI002882FEC6|nr:uncharacterized protein LOC100240848 isoform X3 [Vitis vinifera]
MHGKGFFLYGAFHVWRTRQREESPYEVYLLVAATQKVLDEKQTGDSKHLDGKNRSNSRTSVHPVLLVQLVLKWKLLQNLGSFLTVLPKQNVQYATCWAFY